MDIMWYMSQSNLKLPLAPTLCIRINCTRQWLSIKTCERRETYISKSLDGTHQCPVLKIRISELSHWSLISSNLSNKSVDWTLFGACLGTRPCCTRKTERKNSMVKLKALNRTPKNLIRFVI